jgi:glutamate---cysteine ligase / carboxylate-amine ligase
MGLYGGGVCAACDEAYAWSGSTMGAAMSHGMSTEWPCNGSSGTIGVEEEFFLVSPETGLPVPAIESVLETGPERVTREFVQELVEANTPICDGPESLLDAMLTLRGSLSRDAARSRCAIAGVGVHAFTAPEDLTLTDTDRYREMSGSMPWTWREATTCGMHVHVGIADPEEAIHVSDRLRTYLPVLLALSVNSPLWRGQPTGMCSIRTALRRLQPRVGIPPRHGSWAAFNRRMAALARAGVPDGSWIWWAVRPHATFGTIEMRVFDTQSDVRNAHALAALTAALVAYLLESEAGDDLFLVSDEELLAESWYNAMRNGPSGLHAFGVGNELHTPPLAESALRLVSLLERRLDRTVTSRLRALAMFPEASLQLADFERGGSAGAMIAAAHRTTHSWIAPRTVDATVPALTPGVR